MPIMPNVNNNIPEKKEMAITILVAPGTAKLLNFKYNA
jgi:hypothetical protein